MTFVISLVNSKGGVGKTTLAFALATHWNAKNMHCLLIDCDAQASLTTLFGVRQDKGNMEAMPVDLSRLEARLKTEMRDNVHDMIIIDTPGNLDHIRPAISIADIVLIPVQASGPDYFAFNRVFEICKKHHAKTILVPNRVKTTRDEASVLPTLEALSAGKALISPFIGDRVDHRVGTIDGLSIVDIEPGGKGAIEIARVANMIEGEINGKKKSA